MRTISKMTLALVAVTLAAAGCKKKKATAGGEAGAGAGAGAGNSGATNPTPVASTQKGCVNKLGADLPQGDIILKAECGPVTLEGEVYINAKLTIEPGVKILAVDKAWLGIGNGSPGAIIAAGTSDAQITFTSSTTKTPGAWQGIQLYDGAKGSVLEHVIIEYAGGADGDESGAYSLKAEGHETTISNTIIREGRGYGILVAGDGAEDRFSGLIFDCNFSKLSRGAMQLHAPLATFIGANDYDDKAVVELTDGTIHKDATLHPAHYRLMGNVNVSRATPNVPPPVLTLEAGVILEGVAGTELSIGYGDSGVLRITGVPEKPVVATSFDKRNDSWNGIRLYDHARDVSIQHLTLSYAESTAELGALRITDPAAEGDIKNVTCDHLAGVCISVAAGPSKVKLADIKGSNPPVFTAE